MLPPQAQKSGTICSYDTRKGRSHRQNKVDIFLTLRIRTHLFPPPLSNALDYALGNWAPESNPEPVPVNNKKPPPIPGLHHTTARVHQMVLICYISDHINKYQFMKKIRTLYNIYIITYLQPITPTRFPIDSTQACRLFKNHATCSLK